MKAPRPLANRWEDLLADEGYRPKLERNTDAPQLARIAFTAERTRFTLWLDDEDEDFYHFTAEYEVGEHPPPPGALAEATGYINERVKGVKVTLDEPGEWVTFHAEGFQRGPVAPDILERLLYQLRHAANDWFERVRPHRRPVAEA